MKRRPAPSEPVTAERIERSLALCAYLVARDESGLAYVPIMDRLEAELLQARAEVDPVLRARRLLASGRPGVLVAVPQIAITDRGAAESLRRDEQSR